MAGRGGPGPGALEGGGAGGGEPEQAPATPTFSHLDVAGRARMVDVGAKAPTRREAEAFARIDMSAETLERLMEGALPKGDVFAVARVAGIMAAKRTADLIPLCHPLPLDAVEIQFEPLDRFSLAVRCRARTTARTGVEMEALCGAAIAALTVYDMIKAVERGACVSEVKLLRKSGGRSGDWRREQAG